MKRTYAIMYRQVEININGPEVVSDIWTIAKQKVYIDMWEIAGRGQNKEANKIGRVGEVNVKGIKVTFKVLSDCDHSIHQAGDEI